MVPDNILELFGLKSIFFLNQKNCHISIGDSGRTVEGTDEIGPKIASGGRNLQENIFG